MCLWSRQVEALIGGDWISVKLQKTFHLMSLFQDTASFVLSRWYHQINQITSD